MNFLHFGDISKLTGLWPIFGLFTPGGGHWGYFGGVLDSDLGIGGDMVLAINWDEGTV